MSKYGSENPTQSPSRGLYLGQRLPDDSRYVLPHRRIVPSSATKKAPRSHLQGMAASLLLAAPAATAIQTRSRLVTHGRMLLESAMGTVASICTSCGLIAITLKRGQQGSRCIKCAGPLEVYRAPDIDELWRTISTSPPPPYSSPGDRELLQLRFRKARERFDERARQREENKRSSSERKPAAYFARKGLREAKLARRFNRRDRSKK